MEHQIWLDKANENLAATQSVLLTVNTTPAQIVCMMRRFMQRWLRLRKTVSSLKVARSIMNGYRQTSRGASSMSAKSSKRNLDLI